MTNLPAYNIKINVDASGVATGVTMVKNELDAMSSRVKATTGAFSNLKTMAVGVFAGNLLTQGMMAITNAINEAKQGVVADQIAMTRLDQTLENVGITSQKTKDAVLASADAYYKLGFAGDDSITAMGSLVAITKDVDQANKLLMVSADLARYNHISQTDAARLLGKATMGNVKALKDLGIALDEDLPKNKAVEKAIADLSQRINGQAIAYTKTFAGQVDILKEKFDNFLQLIGTRILPVLSQLLSFITQNGAAILYLAGTIAVVVGVMKTYAITTAALKSIQQAYAFWTYAQAASTNVFRFALSALWTTMKANPIGAVVTALTILGAGFIYAWNKFEGFRRAFAVGLQQIVQGLGYLVGGVAKTIRALSYLPGNGYLKGIADSADKAALAMGRYAKSVLDLSNKKIGGPKINDFVAPNTSGITANPTVDTKGNKGGDKNVQYVTVYASNTNDIAKKLSKAAKNGLPVGGQQ